jgi:maltose-binding protein MalE
LVEGYFVSAQAQHPDACWKWISFLSQQIPNRQVPARTSLAESAEYENLVGEQIASAARASLEGALLLSPELAEFEPVLETFGNAFLAIVNEQSTPEEAMVWAQQQSAFK